MASTVSTTNSLTKYWTVSFSGAGHLLPYHLGVAKTLIGQRGDPNQTKSTKTIPSLESNNIRAVAGSSSGAIAATVLTLLPHRLNEYTDRFLQDRGHAFRNLQEMVLEEDGRKQQQQQQQKQLTSYTDDTVFVSPDRPLLVIGTTRCSDGALQLFSYGRQDDGDNRERQNEYILRAVQASCTIPRFFHPVDVITKYDISYPEDDGVEIDGISYVDGGIAAPSPPTPLDSSHDCQGRIIVSPISGGVVTGPPTAVPSNILQIRPKDTTFALPFQLTARCRTFQIRPSVQNLRAVVVAIGLASPGVLRDWYDRGLEDGQTFLDSQEETC